jgi:hypothetical protein
MVSMSKNRKSSKQPLPITCAILADSAKHAGFGVTGVLWKFGRFAVKKSAGVPPEHTDRKNSEK